MLQSSERFEKALRKKKKSQQHSRDRQKNLILAIKVNSTLLGKSNQKKKNNDNY